MEHGALPIFCSVVSATKPPKDVQLNTDIVVAVHKREDDVSDDERQHVLGYVLLLLLRLWRILLMI